MGKKKDDMFTISLIVLMMEAIGLKKSGIGVNKVGQPLIQSQISLFKII